MECEKCKLLQVKIDSLIDDVKEFNRGWTDRQQRKPFDEDETDIWQQGWMVFDYDHLNTRYEQLKSRVDAGSL